MNGEKNIPVLALLASAATAAFANLPGAAYIQCDPRSHDRPSDVRRTAGSHIKRKSVGALVG
jgi:hypothetical protein